MLVAARCEGRCYDVERELSVESLTTACNHPVVEYSQFLSRFAFIFPSSPSHCDSPAITDVLGRAVRVACMTVCRVRERYTICGRNSLYSLYIPCGNDPGRVISTRRIPVILFYVAVLVPRRQHSALYTSVRPSLRLSHAFFFLEIRQSIVETVKLHGGIVLTSKSRRSYVTGCVVMFKF